MINIKVFFTISDWPHILFGNVQKSSGISLDVSISQAFEQ